MEKLSIAILEYSTCMVHILHDVCIPEGAQTEEIEELLEVEGFRLSDISYMVGTSNNMIVNL